MKDYYQDSLNSLRVLGARFAEAHPMVAPLLNSQSADPDVERILEGVAFLSGLIEQRLDNNFPEIVYTLLELTAPEILRPIPSQSIIKYTPLGVISGIQHQPQGSYVRSIPIDGTACTFSTMRACNILPVSRSSCTLTSEIPQKADFTFNLEGFIPYKDWAKPYIDIYFDDNLARATQWMMTLMRYTKKIILKMGSQTIEIPTSSLQFLLPESAIHDKNKESVLSSFSHIRSFFAFTNQFLFLRLTNLDKLSPRATDTRLSIIFSLEGFSELPDLHSALLNVNMVPIINMFPHESVPMVISHQQQDYRLVPEGDKTRQMEIYKIQEVSGIQRGGVTKAYHSYSAFESRNLDNRNMDTISGSKSHTENVYSIRRSVSPVNGRMEYYLSILYQKEEDLKKHETLVSKIFCYHHVLPKRLRAGDINIPTDTSPAMATFTNIVPPSSPVPAPTDTNLLWQLFSHLHANLLSLASAEALRHFLSLLLPGEGSDATLILFNQKRLASIKGFTTIRDEMLVKGRPISGQILSLTVDSTGFTSFGELYIFAHILEQSLNRFATLNTYTKFELKDTVTGETITWPPRLGKKLLI